MKKNIIIGVCVLVVAFFGFKACGKKGADPVDVAKSIVEQKFEATGADLSKLDYDKVEVTEEAAVIKVKGKILFEEEISLVKDGDNWVVGEAAPAEEAEAEDHAAPAEHAEAPAHH